MGALRQHPELAARLVPIAGLISDEEVAVARGDSQLAVASAVRILSEREAAFNVHILAKTALDLGLKGVTIDTVEQRIGQLVENRQLIPGVARAGDKGVSMVTTQEALRTEESILKAVEAGAGKAAPIVPAADAPTRLEAAADRPLNAGQLAAATLTRQGQEGMEVKLNCQRGKTQIKVEVNPTLRGHLLPLRDMPCSDRVQERFEAFVEARCLSHGELFGGKICAALDRQHPRDLFDVKRLLDREGLVDEVRHGFVAALVSHGRPVAELIRPSRKDHSETFKAQFEGMPLEPFTYDHHVQTLDRLVREIHASMDGDDRRFLESFEAGEPAWECYPLPTIRKLPAPRFKLMNIRKFREMQPKRYDDGLAVLQKALLQ